MINLNSKSDVSDGVGTRGHVVGSSGENDVGVSDEDVLAAVDDGLKAGSAKSVDGQGRRLLPHAASQGNVTRNVGGVDGRAEVENIYLKIYLKSRIELLFDLNARLSLVTYYCAYVVTFNGRNGVDLTGLDVSIIVTKNYEINYKKNLFFFNRFKLSPHTCDIFVTTV